MAEEAKKDVDQMMEEEKEQVEVNDQNEAQDANNQEPRSPPVVDLAQHISDERANKLAEESIED